MRSRLVVAVVVGVVAAIGAVGEALGQAGDPPMYAVIEAVRDSLPPDVILDVGPVSGDPVAATGTVQDVRVRFDPTRRAGPPRRSRETALRSLSISRLELSGARLDAAARPAAARSIVVRDYAFSFESGVEARVEEMTYADLDLGGASTPHAWLTLAPTARSGPVAVRGLAFEQPRQRVSGRLERARLDGLAEGVVSGLMLEGLGLTSREGEFGVARLHVPRLDNGLLMSLTPQDGAGRGPAMPDTDPLAALATLLGALPAIDIEGVTFAEGRADGDSLEVARVGYAVAPVEAEGSRMRVAVADLVFRPGRRGAGEPLAADLAEVPLGLGADLIWNEATRRLRVEPARLTAGGLAALELTAELGGVPPTAGVALDDPRAFGELMALVPLRNATVTLTDEAFFERILARRAAERGQDRLALAADLRGLVESGLAGTALTPGDPKVEAMLDALEAFLRRPGRLDLTFAPADPQALAVLAIMAQRMPALLLDATRAAYTPPPTGR